MSATFLGRVVGTAPVSPSVLSLLRLRLGPLPGPCMRPSLQVTTVLVQAPVLDSVAPVPVAVLSPVSPSASVFMSLVQAPVVARVLAVSPRVRARAVRSDVPPLPTAEPVSRSKLLALTL